MMGAFSISQRDTSIFRIFYLQVVLAMANWTDFLQVSNRFEAYKNIARLLIFIFKENKQKHTEP